MQTKLNTIVATGLALALTIIGANSAFAGTSSQHFRLQGAVQSRAKIKAAVVSPQFVSTPTVQPYICIDNATTGGGTFASFTNVANRFPLLANLDGPLDQVGLVVNLQAGTPVGTVSFEVAPNSSTQNLYIAIGGNYITPGGVTGTFRSDNIPNSIFGNQAKNKNLQYNFDLFNLINGVGDVPIPPGSTLTFLLIDVEELFPALVPGSVLVDNVFVNGHAVSHKDVTPVGTCPIPF
ncbi:MAG: hypothetical protein HYX67_00050 [Candidatus Melainabacteria bacterium]|nr:hypothetical protein [Candidatus Melainabacteria bacterium]